MVSSPPKDFSTKDLTPAARCCSFITMTKTEIVLEENRFVKLHYGTAEAQERLMRDILFDFVIGVETACPEGCEVEPDGKCPHGYRSVARVLGLI